MTDEIKQETSIDEVPLAQEEAEVKEEAKPETESQGEPEVNLDSQEEQADKSLEELPLPEEEKDYEKNWPKGFKERLKRQSKQLEQREMEARMLAEELASIKGSLQQKEVKTAPEALSAPRRENFTNDDEYIEAMVEHKANLREQEKRSEWLKQQEFNAQVERKKRQEKIDADGVKKYADYDETVSNLFKPDFPANPALYMAIAKSKYASDILYHFGRHLDKAKETAQLDPVEAIKRVVKLEERLEARQKNNVSKMPPPLSKTPSGATTNMNTKDPDKMSPSEYRQHREEQRQRQLGRR